VAPELPSDVVRLVDTALSFHPEVRWQTAREMQAAVRAARAMTTAPTKQAAKLVVVSFESDETSPSSVPAQVNVTSNPTLPMGSAHTPSEPARK
jgi:hypothetical protein